VPQRDTAPYRHVVGAVGLLEPAPGDPVDEAGLLPGVSFDSSHQLVRVAWSFENSTIPRSSQPQEQRRIRPSEVVPKPTSCYAALVENLLPLGRG
jgi:hypothetical protein